MVKKRVKKICPAMLKLNKQTTVTIPKEVVKRLNSRAWANKMARILLPIIQAPRA